jgi:hypothetical protein
MACECRSVTLKLAMDIQRRTANLVQEMQDRHFTEPSLQVGAKSELWEHSTPEVAKMKTEIIGLSRDLTKLLLGPRGFLHDLVSPNWDLGALYTILEFDILEKIPLGGKVPIDQLAQQSGIPEDKLLRILRLAACEQILEEPSEGVFQHTAISEALVKDENFKAFIGFQYDSYSLTQ